MPQISPDGLDEADEQIIAEVEAGFETVGNLLAAVKLKAAQEEVMRLAKATNVYLDGKAPWKAIKEDPAQAGTSVYVTLCVIDNLKILFAPFLPHTCQQLHHYLGYEGQLFGRQYTEEYTETERTHRALRYDNSAAVGAWSPSSLKPGQPLQKPAPLFKKLEPEIAEQELARLL